MKVATVIVIILSIFAPRVLGDDDALPISEDTQSCLECHAMTHPGIVAGWQKSRHARMTPKQAMTVEGLSRKVSSTQIPEDLLPVVVGCAECHGLRGDAHKDTFEHNFVDIHVVVTPEDCAVCHEQEAAQFSKNIMAHAYGNLARNDTYGQLEHAIAGTPKIEGDQLVYEPVDAETRATTCYYCHGTKLEVTGSQTRETDLGEMSFPKIKGWPNQGVGRVNTDGSLGSCSACHARHRFSMAMARQPHTCRECHVGPDVPAVKVYAASKHGNIYSTHGSEWDFDAVPWMIGRHFEAPTCATCHISLVTNSEGEAVASRTHQVTDRLGWRLFGLIYAHPQPKHPDTSRIKNQDGQSLPTTFDGQFAETFLIDEKTQQTQRQRMQAVCLACHDSSWVKEHFRRHDHAIAKTNASTKVATQFVEQAWKEKLADRAHPFDEAIERQWSDVWLMYANTIRFATAMGGGGDYAVFADGYYQMSRSIASIQEWVKARRSAKPSEDGSVQNDKED